VVEVAPAYDPAEATALAAANIAYDVIAMMAPHVKSRGRTGERQPRSRPSLE
jgi:hypothetical protein